VDDRTGLNRNPDGVETAEMSHTSFALYYEGTDPSVHSIDVGDLAPSLIGLSEAVKAANRVLNGEQAIASVTLPSASSTTPQRGNKRRIDEQKYPIDNR
jgi:hypothetical protein